MRPPAARRAFLIQVMHMRGAHALLAALPLALLATAPLSAGAAPLPSTSCSLFPADNVWNTDISQLPVNSHSVAWLASSAPGSGLLHPDFGAPPYGMPFNVVDNSYPTQNFRFDYQSESDPGPYPFGSSIQIENGSDAHALIVNKDTCKLYEIYNANRNDGTAGSGAIWDLGSNALRPDGWTSADAAGLPILPGLVRYD